MEIKPPHNIILEYFWLRNHVVFFLSHKSTLELNWTPLQMMTNRKNRYVTLHIIRFRMVKIWIHQNTFFSWFFTWRVLIMVYYIIKLILEFQFDLQNPLKQPKMWIFEKWKIIVFGQNHGIFWPKGDLKPCIIMYLGNIHNMSLVPVTFRNFFFQILQNWHFLG